MCSLLTDWHYSSKPNDFGPFEHVRIDKVDTLRTKADRLKVRWNRKDNESGLNQLSSYPIKNENYSSNKGATMVPGVVKTAKNTKNMTISTCQSRNGPNTFFQKCNKLQKWQKNLETMSADRPPPGQGSCQFVSFVFLVFSRFWPLFQASCKGFLLWRAICSNKYQFRNGSPLFERHYL